MENNPIVLKGTRSGALASALSQLLFVVIFTMAIRFLNTYLLPVMDSYGVTSLWDALFGNHPSVEYSGWFIIAGVAKVVFMFITGVMLLSILFNGFIYGGRATMTLVLNEEGKICKISKEDIGFIWETSLEELPCNRIKSIEIAHPTLEKLTATGSISITFMSFSNSKEAECTMDIFHIKNPTESYKAISKAAPEYKGEGIDMIVKENK